MDGFIKVLFYLIIIVFWIVSNIKKQGKWEEKIPDFPEDISPPRPKKPKYQEPQREGESVSDEEKVKRSYESFKLTYDEKLAMRRKKTQSLLKKQRAKKSPDIQPQPVLAAAKPAQKVEPLIIKLPTVIEKQTYHLESSIQEGVIWSVILGPPRSKLRFDWKSSLLRR